MADPAIAAARAAAAKYLADGGYPREAEIVAAGRGDDFAEVRMALELYAIIKPEVTLPPRPAPMRRRIAGEEC